MALYPIIPSSLPKATKRVISGGTQAGGNLFHSFEQFSVPAGSAAYFNNALDIQNIISRVTGGSVSNIDGLLEAKGTANLFLLNPNGIIFGPNASLKIDGSFLASTASSINFADGTQFSATAPQTTPLLTVSIPLGLQFGGTAGGIQVQQSSLQVQPSQTLALMGGEVSVEGGELLAPGGRIELGTGAGAGMVEIEGQQSLGAFGVESLRFPDTVERADVSLTNNASVNVAAGGGGSIAITAQNINIAGGSELRGGLGTNMGSPGAQAGDISLIAQGAIDVENSFIYNNVGARAVGNGGNIDIQTGSLSVTNVARLVTSTFGQGDAGSINIFARDTVSFGASRANIEMGSNRASSFAHSSVSIGGVGKGGDINITARSLSVINGAQLSASTSGKGNAGSVIINARDRVSFDGRSSDGNGSNVFSSVERIGRGRGGDIHITTGELSVSNGAQLVASTSGKGNAGSVIINARDRVSFDGRSSDGNFVSDVFSSVERTGRGQGGDIRITTGELSLTNGAQLIVGTRGRGNAGNVLIDARDSVSLEGVGNDGYSTLITASTHSEAGEGGRITVTTGSFRVADGAIVDARTESSRPGGSVTINSNSFEATNGGQINTTTNSIGQAGKITLNVSGSVTLSGSDPTYASRLAQFRGRVANRGGVSGVFASTNSRAQGKGGDIFVNSRYLTVQDDARIAVNSQGTGEGGNIDIKAGSLTLNNQALISAETVSSQGGDITIGLQDILLLSRGSQISTTAGTARLGGDGGNITINAPSGFIVAAPLEYNSDITANAFSGQGGKVTINATGIFGIAPLSRQELERLRPEDLDPLQLSTNDITAISQTSPSLSGTVEINTPDVDLSNGLATLPAELVDVSGLIAQGCPGSRGNVGRGVSEFIITLSRRIATQPHRGTEE